MAQKGYIKNSLTKDLGAPEMANMFQGIFGASGIMSLYENLACVKVDNNTVRMSSGAYNLSGHLLGIAKGTTEDLTIDSGTSGQNRNDLIVAEFVRNGGGLGVDTLHFTVVKGTSTSGTAADPALTQQDINAAGVTRQEALYRVKVVGTEITAVEKVAGSVSNLNLVDNTVTSHLAESVSETKMVTWGLTNTGNQVITFDSLKSIKRLDVIAVNPFSSVMKRCKGFYSINGGSYCEGYFATEKYYKLISGVLVDIYETGGVATRATVSISGNILTLEWTKLGSGATGTTEIAIIAHTH